MKRASLLWLLVAAFALIMFAQSVSAACTMAALAKANYSVGETISLSVTCDNKFDENDPYNVTIRNSTGALMAVSSGTTPATFPGTFYPSIVIPVGGNVTNGPGYVVNFTKYNSYSSAIRGFNVSGLAVNQFLVTDFSVLYGGDWYWSEQNAIRAKVYDYQGRPVVGAICKLDVYESINGEPYITYADLRTGFTGSDGDVLFNIYVDFDIFDFDTSYLAEIHCMSQQGVTLSNVSGSGSGYSSFSVGSYVTGLNATLASGLSEVDALSSDQLCLNITNNYRDYAQGYDVTFQMACDVPNQDVVVFSTTNRETFEADETKMHCAPITIPEIAADGSGYCKVNAWVNPDGDSFSNNFGASSDVFLVNPSYFDPISDWEKISRTDYRLDLSIERNLTNRTLRVGTHLNNLPAIDSMIAATLNISGVIYNGSFSTFLSPEDAEQYEIAILFRGVTVTNDQTPRLHLVFYSQTSWMDGVLAALQSIAASLSAWLVGTSEDPVGNYTSVVASLASSSIGANQPIVSYSMTAQNLSKRKQLHFMYEFAPVVGGIEGAFVDQNVDKSGYQALDVYQAIVLNQTKSFNLTLYPELAIGNYTMYATVYEISGDAPESKTDDERIIAQASYSLQVTSQKYANFGGEVLQMDGVIMQAVS